MVLNQSILDIYILTIIGYYYVAKTVIDYIDILSWKYNSNCFKSELEMAEDNSNKVDLSEFEVKFVVD